jgi:hypothetical protein
MSVLTPKRVFLFVVAVLSATVAFADNPSPRTHARMAWDTTNQVGVLFGGRSLVDGATGVAHSADETWLWNGGRWLQRFPQNRPPARSAHSMAFDPNHGKVYVFGGRVEAVDKDSEPTFLNDLWAWKDDDWAPADADSATKPTPRHYSGLAYDPVSDRLVMYGGNKYGADGTTIDPNFETWEFDGTQWTNVTGSAPPEVAKPVLTWDPSQHKIVMLGVDVTATSGRMYTYDTATHTWTAVTPVTPAVLPTCINEGYLSYDTIKQRLVFFGGLCSSGTSANDEVWVWNGTTWAKITTDVRTRGIGQATAYDPLRGEIVTFGGSSFGDSQFNSVTARLRVNGVWSYAQSYVRPLSRSLAAMSTNPLQNNVVMFGGLDEYSFTYYLDFWGYRSGQWSVLSAANGPATCEAPLSAFDVDRNKLVLTCTASTIYEWDGATWKSFTALKKTPSLRHFASMVYDAKLKKVVLFGGYESNNYRNDTWTWNGTEWTELSISNKKRPPHRGLTSMWYDPLQQKTIVYGGLGRASINEKVTRYSDMWAFNGTEWTKLDVATTPGTRFGAAIAVNPVTGKLLLFGGLRSEALDEDAIRQYFDKDTWEWNGADSKWTLLAANPDTVGPDTRENASMAWDPVAGSMILYGGYADGFYRSDLWTWDGQDWIPHVEAGGRRRATH